MFTNLSAPFRVLLLLVVSAAVASAQIKSSAITGTVSDASGAVVPNATVVITNVDTNVTQELRTNAVGVYTLPYLAAGRFSLLVKADGFQSYRQTDIVLATATTVRVDAVLSPGNLQSTVEVRADAATLQTETSTVQSAVNANLIATLPNINNNPLYYASLQAGVVPAPQMYTSTRLGVGFQDRQAMSAMRINGGLMGTNDVQLDGLSVQGAAWHETTVVPDRDTLQEVRVISNSFSADQGAGQGLISMITKSGTNEYHGTLRYRLRNEALNANGLNNNLRGIRRPKYRLNEGGGTLGGPVILPKLYNGKDKLFFFASFYRLTHSDPVTYQTRVPTDLERRGDFSQTKVADNAGNPVPVQIFDPFSARPYNNSPTVFIRQPFANAIVTNPSPFGLKILGAYPQPNNPPTDAFQNNNYFFSGITPTVRNSLSSRIDFHPNTRHSIYLSGGFTRGSISQPNRWGEGNPFVNMAFPGVTEDENPYAQIGDTVTLSPSTVLDVRYGATRIRTNSSYPAGTGFDYSAYGMPREVQALSAMFGTAPSIFNFGGPIASLNADGWARKRETQLNHTLNGSVTKTARRWTIKAGAEYRVYLGNWQDLRYATPALNGSNHNGQLGGLSGGNSSLITDPALRGISFATMLTGVAGYEIPAGTSTRPALAAKYFGLYSQNDWKVSSKLTVNLGLRWEVQPGPTERYNRISGIDLTTGNPYTAGISLPNPLGALGLIAFPGTGSYSRNLWDTQWSNFSPRLGLAYRIRNSTVMRAGYGRAYTPSNTGFNANGLIYGTGPFSGGAQANPYGLAPNGVPIGRWENLGNTIVIPAPGANQAPALYGNNNAALSVDLIPRNYRNGVVDQWNFFIERNVGKAWLVGVGYVGSHGTDLQWRGFPLAGTHSISDDTLAAWRSGWLASNGLNDPATVQVPNPLPALVGKASGGINGANIATLHTLKPYLGLLGQTYLGNGGISDYHALQIRVERPLSNGLQAMFNYTWSKASGLVGGSGSSTYAESQAAGLGTTASGGTDFRNLANNRGLLGYDVPHRLVVAATYELPFGQGKPIRTANSVVNYVAEGWQFSTAITLQSGQPWGPSCGGMNGRCFENSGEAVEVPAELQRWYDGRTPVTLPSGRVITPAAFTHLKWNPDRFRAPVVQLPNGSYQVDQYYWGPTAKYVNGLRTPGFYNANLTVNRQFRLAERFNLEFLAEATNFLNKTNINPNAVNGGVNAVLAANAATNTKIGQNSNINHGSLSTSFFEPRQLSLSLRLRF
ncbi:MAG: TonB-dependent receptor [Bryobacterales bacterium]|nr:TonB-dependent receptor [Bryobacterales bacterium]